MAAKKRQHAEKVEMVRLLVSKQRGADFIIEIPADWRVTFGYVNPSKSSDGFRNNEGHCLRVWEGEKLRGVWGDVTGFRDLSIPLASKVTRETGSASWTKDSEGNFEHTEQREREQTFQIEPGDDDVAF